MGIHRGKTALVTGAAGGIGRAAAEIFAREGARVAVVDRNGEGARETLARIEAAGGTGIVLEADVSDEESVAAMVSRCADEFGRLDCAFNNAGISGSQRSFHELPLAEWQETLDINLTGVFLCLKHELVQMVQQDLVEGARGALVNTSSGAGIVPAPGQPHYTAAKHGVLGITKNVAQEYAKRKIRCNAVLPGVTDTPMLKAVMEQAEPGYRDFMESISVGGVLTQAEEVAEAAVWLCSQQARRVSGQSLIVDGGGVFH